MKIKTDTPIYSGNTSIYNKLPSHSWLCGYPTTSKYNEYNVEKPLMIDDKVCWTEDELRELIKNVVNEMLVAEECNSSVTSDDFPEKPVEGQYFEIKGMLYRYLNGIWVRLK